MTSRLDEQSDADYLLIGGGLQNALILLALAKRNPTATVLMLEQDQSLGGNHIWSFQALDLPVAAKSWAAPVAEYTWPGYQLHFQQSARWVGGTYSSLSSEHLDRLLRQAEVDNPNIRIRTGARVRASDATSATLEDGTVLRGRLVVDARGPESRTDSRGGGYQKFMGLECKLRCPAPITAPILMDTRCTQRNGFRFLYVLPLEPNRVLVEDTYFSNSPEIDAEALRAPLVADAAAMGLDIERVLRTEVGVLPMPSRNVFNPQARGPIQGGYTGGWFNPGTGYSFAAAIRLAEHLSQVPIEQVFGPQWRRLVRRMRVQAVFFAFLNRLMFGFFHDAQRRRLMERFYLLPDPVIHRFFAMETTLADQWRILWVGAPWTPKGWARRPETQPPVTSE